MHQRTLIGIALITVATLAPARTVMAQEDRLKKIEARLDVLEQARSAAGGSFDGFTTFFPGALYMLGIGLFCGLWARNSGATSGSGSSPDSSSISSH